MSWLENFKLCLPGSQYPLTGSAAHTVSLALAIHDDDEHQIYDKWRKPYLYLIYILDVQLNIKKEFMFLKLLLNL